jgi:hypothetical protein
MAKIVQIMPGGGWKVAYNVDHTEEVTDVVCWALLDNGEISAMDMDIESGYAFESAETGNFARLIPPTNRAIDLDSLDQYISSILNSGMTDAQLSRAICQRVNAMFAGHGQ